MNVAATCLGTRALGPGRRSVVWVQGCPFRCAGCIAPDWIPDREANLVPADVLAEELLADPAVDGLTFSGGEPMAQAGPLAAVAAHARRIRDVSLVCFTGYTLRQLRGSSAPPDAAALLSHVDVLIDGRYVAARDDGLGLRGSANQGIHHLTDRLRDHDADLTRAPRSAEIRISGDLATMNVFLVGVPTLEVRQALDGVRRDLGREYGLV